MPDLLEEAKVLMGWMRHDPEAPGLPVLSDAALLGRVRPVMAELVERVEQAEGRIDGWKAAVLAMLVATGRDRESAIEVIAETESRLEALAAQQRGGEHDPEQDRELDHLRETNSGR